MVISTCRLPDTCSRTPSLHEHSRGAALGGGGSWSSLMGPCILVPSQRRCRCGCWLCWEPLGRTGHVPLPALLILPWLAPNWCFTEAQLGVRELEANRQTKLYPVFPWSWPTIPKLQPVLGQSTGEGNPSLPLHRENHCIPQHFCLGRMY